MKNVRDDHYIPNTYVRKPNFCGSLADRPVKLPLLVNMAASASLLSIQKYQHQPTEFLAERAQAHLDRLGRGRMFDLKANPDRVTALAILEGIQ